MTSNVVTYTVIIDAPNPEGKLYPGMTANITIISTSEEGVLIPLEAASLTISPDMELFMNEQGYEVQRIKDGDDNNSVFLINGKKLIQTQIETGLSDGANVAVKKGVVEGDNVVRSVAKQSIEKKRESTDNPLQMGPPQHKTR